MPRKFNVGDKVVIKKLNTRTPKHILGALRLDNPRTITATFYDPKAQHTRYYLGTNKRGDVDLSAIHFRASQLTPWDRGDIGRPRLKRPYASIRPQSPNKGIPSPVNSRTLNSTPIGLLDQLSVSQRIMSLNALFREATNE